MNKESWWYALDAKDEEVDVLAMCVMLHIARGKLMGN
jgi:hypothetical protein